MYFFTIDRALGKSVTCVTRKLFAPARGGHPYRGLSPVCAEVRFMQDDQYGGDCYSRADIHT